jgi:apolipoprotein N-acyltransferase
MIAGLRQRVANVRGWRRTGVAMLAGLLSVLALAPFFVAPVLFLTLPVLVWLIAPERGAMSRRNDLWRAFKDGWWFGFGYFFAGLFWVGEAFLVEAEIFGWLLPFAVTLLPAGLALFYGAAAAVTRALWRPGLAGLLIMAVVFAAAEWLRGHILTGFPWNVLGYALTAPVELMQSAGLVGIYGLTLWTVVIFAAPLVLAAETNRQGSELPRYGAGAVLALGPLLVAFAYGALVLAPAKPDNAEAPRLRIVQPSVPQREKWMPEKQAEIFALHLDLSRRNSQGVEDGLAGISLVVWPEAAMPFRPLEHPEALNAIGDLLPDPGSILLSGGLRVEPTIAEAGHSREAFNSLLAISDTGQVSAIYDKIHLVPFGEYLPLQPVLEAIGLQQLTKRRGGFASGPNPRPLLALPGLPPIAGLICYEAIFPAAVVQGDERPGLLVNVTNDGWFGNTTGPRQHLHQARVRAVEEGLPMIRAANNGISAVIDANGRILASLGLNVRGVIDAAVPPARAAPPYAAWGDWLFLLNAMFFLIGAWLSSRNLEQRQ